MKSLVKNRGSIENRLNILTTRWNQLMMEQDQLSSSEVASEEFQARKKRIAGLYQRATSEATKEKRDAIRCALESVSPSRFINGVVKPNSSVGFKF